MYNHRTLKSIYHNNLKKDYIYNMHIKTASNTLGKTIKVVRIPHMRTFTNFCFKTIKNNEKFCIDSKNFFKLKFRYLL